LANLALDEKENETARTILNFILLNTQDSDLQIEANYQLLNLDIEKAIEKDYTAIQQKLNLIIEQYGISPYSIKLQILKAHFESFYLKNFEAAKTVLQKALELPLNNFQKADVKMELADVLLLDQKFNQAIIYYAQIEDDLKNDEMAHEASFKMAKASYYKGDFDVVSNPEFLREGTAVSDFMHPDRIVIGNGSLRAEKILKELYINFDTESIIFTDIKTAELIKYASNAFLATEISFINSIANMCEKLGADVEKVAQGMMLDKRIGTKAFLHAGVGYGGSCFPKDVKGLIQISQENGIRFGILEEVENTNEAQKKSLLVKELSFFQKQVLENFYLKKEKNWIQLK
jgi:tetratricopeptide (TPR) repeat protein